MSLEKPEQFSEIDQDEARDHCNVETFKKYGKTSIKLGKDYVIQIFDLFFVVKNDALYYIYNNKTVNNEIEAIVIKHKGKTFLVTHADDDIELYYEGSTEDISISFNCLGQFLGKTGEETIKIFSKSFEILAFTKDSRRDLTKSEIEQFKNGKYIPPTGYTVIGYGNNILHRSATILLKYNKTGEHLLMGQDEGTYFLCALKGKPRTVGAAYLDLIPKEVRGKTFKRQGEWFFILCEKPEGGMELEVEDILILPREIEDSNRHRVSANKIVVKNNILYLNNFKVTHDQHVSISENGWASVHKNTAIKSFSQEGVD